MKPLSLKKSIVRIAALCLALICPPISAMDLFAGLYKDSAGCSLLRKGEFAQSLDSFAAAKDIGDTALHAFAQGYAQEKIGNKSAARCYYQIAAQKNRIFLPVAYLRVGLIDQSENSRDGVLSAWHIAWDSSASLKLKKDVARLICSFVQHEKMKFCDIPWFTDTIPPPLAAAPPSPEVPIALCKAILDHKWAAADTIIQKADGNCWNDSLDTALIFIDSVYRQDQSHLSPAAMFNLSRLEFADERNDKSALWAGRIAHGKEFAKNRLFMKHMAHLSAAQKDSTAAIVWAKEYDSSGTPDPSLIFLIGRSYRTLAQTDSAMFYYRRLIREYPKDSHANDLRVYVASYLEDHGKNDSARKYLRELAIHGSPSGVEDAKIRIGLSFFRDNLFDSAISEFQLFRKHHHESNKLPSVNYWMARSFIAAGKPDSALTYANESETAAPWDYYGWMSRCLRATVSGNAPPDGFTLDTLIPLDKWVDSIDHETKSLSRADSIVLCSGAAFILIGLQDYADWIMEPAITHLGASLPGALELSALYRNGGDFYHSYKWARQAMQHIPEGLHSSIPLNLYHLLYPNPYAKKVQDAAEEFNVEPEYVWSIMRQESTFKPDIASPVGATGLMQIMPSTGQVLAKKLKLLPFCQDSLSSPSFSIRCGTYYLHELLTQTGNSFIYATASYNGGPINAKRWAEASDSSDFAMKVERIGFSETRNYVKKVLGNYWTYKYLSSFAVPISKR